MVRRAETTTRFSAEAQKAPGTGQGLFENVGRNAKTG
jgi:hypothetical protein